MAPMSTRIHLVGAAGQLGAAFAARTPADVDLVRYTSTDLDVTDAAQVRSALADLRPGETVVNAAAYTDVDGAQQDAAAAYAVNADGPGHLAAATAAAGARLVHVSTDYVFAPPPGQSAPLEPGDLDPAATPATVYGASKLAGERAARAADPSTTVVRTAWVYTGGLDSPDFVGTMRRLEAARPELSVVDDQRGSPTHVGDLADGLWELVGQVGTTDDRTAGAVLHAAGGGEATWYDLACAVFSEIGADPERVRPCTTADFPRPAPRPAFSVLSARSWAAAGLTPLPHWRGALSAALAPDARLLR